MSTQKDEQKEYVSLPYFGINKLLPYLAPYKWIVVSMVGLGLAGGLVLGVGFAAIQQAFGIIKMPGHFVVQAYPIILSWSDILLTIVGVATIGYLIALLPVALHSRKSRA